MRPCVILNPAAKGERARRFQRQVGEVAAQAVLKLTSAAGDARRLAAEAVQDGFDPIVAAGGDGTLHEVLNGLGDVPEGFDRVRLGVMPLGTVNVFAREMGVPLRLGSAWRVICAGREDRVDLPRVEFVDDGMNRSRYFIQMAGAGLDSRAIELVDHGLKKRVGALAYLIAGVRAMSGRLSRIRASGSGHRSEGQLVLVGNGRRYGGELHLFPHADMRDGLLEICVLPRVNWMVLLRSTLPLIASGRLPARVAERFQTDALELSADEAASVEADGELLGRLPARMSIQRGRLRVIVP